MWVTPPRTQAGAPHWIRRRKKAELQYLFPPCSWLWVQCEQLLPALNVRTSVLGPATPSDGGQKKPFFLQRLLLSASCPSSGKAAGRSIKFLTEKELRTPQHFILKDTLRGLNTKDQDEIRMAFREKQALHEGEPRHSGAERITENCLPGALGLWWKWSHSVRVLNPKYLLTTNSVPLNIAKQYMRMEYFSK